jgi:hypothetical protein
VIEMARVIEIGAVMGIAIEIAMEVAIATATAIEGAIGIVIAMLMAGLCTMSRVMNSRPPFTMTEITRATHMG